VKSILVILSILAAGQLAIARQEVQKDDQEAPRMTVAELLSRLEKHVPVAIVDSRSEGSWESSDKQIKGSVRIPIDQIETRMTELPRDKEIIIYCS
jgi:rhodanese-related sulfurtransferase